MIKIYWPNGKISYAKPGDEWINLANKAGIEIPQGCLRGNCGACEIEVNGEVIRACISEVQGGDVLYIGPYDLSQTMGLPGEVEHPSVLKKMESTLLNIIFQLK